MWGELLHTFQKEFRNLVTDRDNKAKKEPLESFSPWLANFDSRTRWMGSDEESLEIPGQYIGHQRPHVRGHTRIIRFGPQIMVLTSKQKPKRWVILGSDECEHWFLIKGGEDLRLDARLEQLFGVLNDMLAGSRTFGLRVRTYAVVPLRPDLGMLEWVRQTSTIKAIATEMAKVNDLSQTAAQQKYNEFTRKRMTDKNASVQTRYKQVFHESQADVEANFARCLQSLPASASLREYFARAALSPEALWHTRQRFVASLAATSAATYIFNIGDRHLENFLLCTHTMELVPIDFGYSFGIGCQLAVPELVPFRLTGFFASVLQPLGGDPVRGAFHTSLKEVLERARGQRDTLIDTCEIFLQEPCLDWTKQAKSRGETDITMNVRKKLGCMRDRLLGTHPALVLADEIADSPVQWVKEFSKRKDHLAYMVAGRNDSERAEVFRRSSAKLTPSEQADCLIRQATDPNLLGRAWEGWMPVI
jgi:DNA-dependent protein kinase catalytic subunit